MSFLRWFSGVSQSKSVDAVAWAACQFPLEHREVAVRVAEVLVEQLNVRFESLHGTTRFIDDLQMDDLEPVEVVATLEAAFHISIPAEDSRHLETISDLVRYLSARVHTGTL